MKRFIFLMLILASTSALAQDYNCYVSVYKLSFKADEMMSELIIRDRITGEFVYSSHVDNVQNFADQTQYYFGKFKMTFKTKAILNQDETLFGFADGTFGRGFYNTSLRCIKQQGF